MKGQVGAYGRSIGGIAASHITGKFPDLISVFIGDRTMGDFDQLIYNRYSTGRKFMRRLYRLLSYKWQADNVDCLMKNTKCYKIHCFDENDDVVDIYSSTHHGVSSRCTSIDYKDVNWSKFYKSLHFLYQIENQLYTLINPSADYKK